MLALYQTVESIRIHLDEKVSEYNKYNSRKQLAAINKYYSNKHNLIDNIDLSNNQTNRISFVYTRKQSK